MEMCQWARGGYGAGLLHCGECGGEGEREREGEREGERSVLSFRHPTLVLLVPGLLPFLPSGLVPLSVRWSGSLPVFSVRSSSRGRRASVAPSWAAAFSVALAVPPSNFGIQTNHPKGLQNTVEYTEYK
jgi:hypothetical protein